MSREKANRWDKVGLWMCIAFFVILIFMAGRAWSKDYTVNEYFGETKDSLIVGIKAGNTVTWADTMTDVSRYDTTFSLGNDTLWTFCYRYWSPGTDSAGSGYYDFAKPYTAATWQWAQPLYWDFETDSVHGYLYRNGSATPVPLTMTTARTGVQSYDTSISTVSGVDYRLQFLIYPAGGDSLVSYESRLLWDTTGSGITDTLYQPAPSVVDNVCNVYGYVIDASDSAVAYAKITFTLPKKVNNSCDTTLLIVKSKTTYTDGEGYFYLPLVYSSCLDDQKYKMTVEHPDVTDQTRDITVPDSATYRIYW